jgi:hypothetical protein
MSLIQQFCGQVCGAMEYLDVQSGVSAGKSGFEHLFRDAAGCMSIEKMPESGLTC